MAILPTGFVVGTKGVYNVVPTEEIGATILGITSATSTGGKLPVTQTFQFNSAIHQNRLNFSVPVAVSGTLHTYSAQKAYSSGTFAYKQRAFMINGYTTAINGVANTSLAIPGAEFIKNRRALRQKSWGYKYSTAIRNRYFSFTKISGQRTNWSTAPSSLNETFRSTTNNAVDSDDQAMYVTFRSIPGELTYMQGGKNPFSDDYKAVTGG